VSEVKAAAELRKEAPEAARGGDVEAAGGDADDREGSRSGDEGSSCRSSTEHACGEQGQVQEGRVDARNRT